MPKTSSLKTRQKLVQIAGWYGVAASKKDAQPVVLNIVWAAIALLAIVNILR